MSRTLDEIQASILLKKEQTASLSALEVLTTNEKNTLAGLNSNSKAAIWRLWVFIQAFAIWLHEQIFDAHIVEIEELIALNKIHTARWYKARALDFQLGFEYPETEITGYDNVDVDEALIIQSKIIAQASVEEIAGRLKIKVAKNTANILEDLTTTEINAFTQYMQLIKDAGTRLQITSRPPDDFRLTLDVYFDPLVLDGNGTRLDGFNNTPVIEAISNFLYNLEFNGEFLTDSFENALRAVEGVELVGVNNIEAKFGSNPYQPIIESYIADAGYMVLNLDETTINYIPREF